MAPMKGKNKSSQSKAAKFMNFFNKSLSRKESRNTNCLCFQLFHVIAVNEIQNSDKDMKLRQDSFGDNWRYHLSGIAQY